LSELFFKNYLHIHGTLVCDVNTDTRLKENLLTCSVKESTDKWHSKKHCFRIMNPGI